MGQGTLNIFLMILVILASEYSIHLHSTWLKLPYCPYSLFSSNRIYIKDGINILSLLDFVASGMHSAARQHTRELMTRRTMTDLLTKPWWLSRLFQRSLLPSCSAWPSTQPALSSRAPAPRVGVARAYSTTTAPSGCVSMVFLSCSSSVPLWCTRWRSWWAEHPAIRTEVRRRGSL